MMRGRFVTVRPLTIDDVRALWAVIGADEDTWKWVGSGEPMPETQELLVAEFQRKFDRGIDEYFAIIDNATGLVVGSSAFLDNRPADRHLEIGRTFIAPAYRGGHRNEEAKLLMLTEAFENRDCVRVTLKANATNTRSRAAIEKIGASFEGVLRRQRLERDDTWRDAAYYSVIIDEWPETKKCLTDRLHS